MTIRFVPLEVLGPFGDLIECGRLVLRAEAEECLERGRAPRRTGEAAAGPQEGLCRLPLRSGGLVATRAAAPDGRSPTRRRPAQLEVLALRGGSDAFQGQRRFARLGAHSPTQASRRARRAHRGASSESHADLASARAKPQRRGLRQTGPAHPPGVDPERTVVSACRAFFACSGSNCGFRVSARLRYARAVRLLPAARAIMPA